MTSSLAVTLHGRYVTLTPLLLADVPGLVRAGSEDRSTYQFSDVPETAEAMHDTVVKLLVEQDALLGVPFATRNSATGEIVGMTRFLSLRWWFERDFPDAAEIGGTFLAASSQRSPINTEAKLLMLGHAFDVWAVERLDLKTDARNERSRRAIERVGAKLDGVLRHWQPSMAAGEAGRPRDSAIYSIIPSEWPGIRLQLTERLE
jgi:RimJ/RimL family protein N-acetyltransferase